LDLVVSKAVSRGAVLVGRPLTYTITVANNGSAATSNVRQVSAFKLPPTVTSVQTTQGTCTNGRPVRCSLGTLAPHSHATITIKGLAAVAEERPHVRRAATRACLRQRLAKATIEITNPLACPAAARPRPNAHAAC